MKIIDIGNNVVSDVGDILFRKRQEVPQWFIDQLKDLRNENSGKRAGNFMLVASVPVIIHEEWLKQGFDMTREPYKETLKRLRSLSLDDFIATDKRV